MTLFTMWVGHTREQRLRVEGNRVARWRLGPVELDRSRECLYLVTLDDATAPLPQWADGGGPTPCDACCVAAPSAQASAWST